MPYCQECGSHIEQDLNTCSNCGNKVSEAGESNVLLPETDPETIPQAGSITSPPLDAFGQGEYQASVSGENFKDSAPIERAVEPDRNPTFQETPGGFIPQEGIGMGSHRNQIESHLGKGLIKPVVIENCMDGYHFRYDEPPRQITKPEPQQEKVIEFRFSGETGPSAEAKENSEAIVEEKGVQDQPENLGNPENTGVEPETKPTVEPEAAIEAEPQSDQDIGETGGETIPVEGVGLPEDELLPEIESPEPEIRIGKEPEVIWKGRRTWYGLALKEEYRITDQSLISSNGTGLKYKEVEWRSVTGIALKQNWLMKMLNLGNLEIIGENSEPLLLLEGIDHPEQLQKMLVETVSSKV